MRTALVWGTFVIVIGCGGNNDDGRPVVNTTSSDVCSDVAEVGCFNMYQCCSESEIEKILDVTDPRTQAECVSDLQTVCERSLADRNFSLKNKRVRFDAKIMNDCLTALVAPKDTCSTISAAKPWTDACLQNAWVGLVDAGGACDFADECTTGNVCGPNRICTPLPGDGMPCSIQLGCATGFTCAVNVCRALVAAGGACTTTPQCQKGLFCDTGAATPSCTPQHQIGEACTTVDACASATCLPGTCTGQASFCFSDANCSGHCANSNTLCQTDFTCSTGTCSGTATLCASNLDCTVLGSICVFPIKCAHAACIGPVACAENHVVVDYCQGAISDLPTL